MTRYLPEDCALTIVDSLAGAEAAIRARPFDLVISDFVFPEGDALHLIFKIRRDFSPERLPVIVLSSSADRYLISKCFAAGVNATVAKPPNVPAFRELVARMIATPSVERPAELRVDAHLVTWSSPVESFVYCPHIDVRTNGPTPEAALQAMAARIREYHSAGGALPVITSPKQCVHYPQDAAQAPP